MHRVVDATRRRARKEKAVSAMVTIGLWLHAGINGRILVPRKLKH